MENSFTFDQVFMRMYVEFACAISTLGEMVALNCLWLCM